MPTRKNSTEAADKRAIRVLDRKSPLGPEQRKQRVLWMLRLLLHAIPRTARQSDLDGEALTVLGLAPETVHGLSQRRLRCWLQYRLKQLEKCELIGESIGDNTRWLAAWLGLSEAQRKVLAFATTTTVSEALAFCVQPLKRLSSSRALSVLADVLGEPLEDVRASLGPQSQLVRSGLLQFKPGRDAHHDEWIALQSPFEDLLAAHYERPEELFSVVCPLASAPELGLDAFPHLSRDLVLLSSLLRGASVARVPGINVLVHGPPGSGKSQLVRSVARALDLPLHQVPDTAPNGDALKGAERVAAVNTMQCLLRGGKPGLVLFDEIEDAFPWAVESGWLRQGSGNDKARTNRLLEENAVPCIWVGNRIGQLDPAFVRRFSLVLEVTTPPRRVREALLQSYSEGLEVPPELRRRLAEQPWVTPADAARAAQVTRLVRTGKAQEPLSDAHVFERALCGGRRSSPDQQSFSELEYDPMFVNASVPLEQLTRGLQQRGEGCVCLYGPPGTGKTAFARQLANALERPLLRRSASDLLDMFVGGTEKAIAEMFDEASKSDSVLLLDEAEGMLRDRCQAVRGFEVTQVNELLVRMEAFRGIFLCATNGFDALDPASLRRFALRIEFSALNCDQNLLLLERTAKKLGIEWSTEISSAARQRLARLTLLTPGDYAALLRGRQLLGDASANTLISDLERVHAEKRAERRIGFRG